MLDPLCGLLGVLFREFRVLHPLLDRQGFWDVAPSLDRRPRAHHLFPLLERGELVDVDARPAGINHPADRRDVGDRDVISDNEARLGALQVLVQHAVQPPGLVDVPLHAVLDLLGRVAHEVVRLALHRPQPRVLEERPVHHLVVLARAPRETDLVLLLVVLVDQVLENAPGLEQPDLLPVGGERVGQGRNAPVRIDLQEPGLLLHVGRDVEVFDLVRQPELL